MKKIILAIILLISLPLMPESQGGEEGLHILKALERKYAAIADYSCDLKVHFDIETFRAPDLQARLYYKRPDKIKIDSKRVIFFPREGGFFNPAQFNPEEYTILPLKVLMSEKGKAVELRLIPKKIKGPTQDIVLTIDSSSLLVRQMRLTQSGGKEVTAQITYGVFGSYELPAQIRLLLDLPPAEPAIPAGPLDAEGAQRVKGEITINYTNYRINIGLRDEDFK